MRAELFRTDSWAEQFPCLAADTPRFWHLLLLLGITGLGLGLRLHGLDAVGLYSDEKYTFPAARGVLETGFPILPSGMLYPRALLQTYLMAGSVWFFGESEWAFRFPSVVVGTACIPLAYLLGREHLRPSLNLCFAVSVAVLPSFIEISQIARMYGFLVFFVLLFLLAVFRWQRTSGWFATFGLILVMILALQIQPLAILMMPLLFIPLLLAPSIRRLSQTVFVVTTSCVSYVLLRRWAGEQYGNTYLIGDQNTAQHPDPFALAGFLDIPAGVLAGLLLITLPVIGLIYQGVHKSNAMTWSSQQGFQLLGAAGLAVSLLGAVLTSYPLALIVLGISTVLHIRAGGGWRTPLLVAVTMTFIFLVQAGWLFISSSVLTVRDIVLFFAAYPSPVPAFRFLEYFPLAVLALVVPGFLDAIRFARGEPLPVYFLVLLFGVAAPLILLGMVVWNVAPRFLLGVVPVFLFSLFLCLESNMHRIIDRVGRRAMAEWSAGLLAVVLLVPPMALNQALSRSYATYPDHQGAAAFMNSLEMAPNDVVVALDASIQSYYLDRVDYWLRHVQSAGYFSRSTERGLVEIYTGIPVIADARHFEMLLQDPARGKVFVIGSGEFESEHAYAYRLGDDILGLFDRYGAEIIFTGRDGRTFIWQFGD